MNGELVRSSTFSFGDVDWSAPASPNITIGALSDGSNAFTGSLDDVRVYNAELSQDEIIATMGDNGFDTEVVNITINPVNDTPTFATLPSENEAIVDNSVTNASVITSGDIDNDGDLDLIGATADGEILWYANDGDGGFGTGTSLFNTIGYDFTSIATGDLDGDGDLDFVVTNNTPDASEDGIFIFENQRVDSGATTFLQTSMETDFFDAYDVAIADIDGDTRLDIVASFHSGEIAVYEQNVADSFTRSLAAAVASARGIDVGDLDGDGSLDIVVASGNSGVYWLENDSAADPTFTLAAASAILPLDVVDVVIANLDGDSDLDIAYVQGSFTTTLGWMENDGAITPTFANATIVSLGSFSSFGNLTAGNFDGTGGVDLAVSQTSSSQIRVFVNDGAANFTEDAQSLTPSGVAWVEAADLDGDGDLDFITAQGGDTSFGGIFNRGSGIYSTVHGNEDTTITGLHVQIDDVDASGTDLEVTLTVTNGTVTIPTGSVTFSTGNSGRTVTFTGTVSEINTALNSFSFMPTADYFGDAQIAISVNDQGNTGSGGNQIGNETLLIHVQSVNDAPALLRANEITNGNFNTDLSSWAVTGNTDWDSGSQRVRFGQIGGANGTISQTFATNIGETYYVQFDYGDASATRSQSLNVEVVGSGSVLDVDVVSSVANNTQQPYTLKFVADSTSSTITFSDTSVDHSGVRGYLDNIEVRSSANTSLTTLTFTEGDAPITVHGWLPIGDVDDDMLSSATIEISSGYVNGEDVLSVTDQLGITATWDATNGRLNLTGLASLGDYETVIQQVTYGNTSDSPTQSTRTLSFSVNDGDLDSANTMTRDINVVAVNDTPVVSGPGSALVATEQTDLSIHGTGFTVTDVDAGSGTMTATIQVGEGIITVAEGNSGVTINSGNGSSTVTLTGTLSEIDNLLTGGGTGTITYFNSSDTPSASTTVTFTVNDGGNTGADPGLTGDGSSEEDSASQTINITSVNDPAVVATNTGITVIRRRLGDDHQRELERRRPGR